MEVPYVSIFILNPVSSNRAGWVSGAGSFFQSKLGRLDPGLVGSVGHPTSYNEPACGNNELAHT